MRIAYTEGNIVVVRIEDTNHVGIVTNVQKKKNQIIGYDVRTERGGGYSMVQIDKPKSKYSIDSALTSVFLQNTDEPTKLYLDNPREIFKHDFLILFLSSSLFSEI